LVRLAFPGLAGDPAGLLTRTVLHFWPGTSARSAPDPRHFVIFPHAPSRMALSAVRVGSRMAPYLPLLVPLS